MAVSVTRHQRKIKETQSDARLSNEVREINGSWQQEGKPKRPRAMPDSAMRSEKLTEAGSEKLEQWAGLSAEDEDANDQYSAAALPWRDAAGAANRQVEPVNTVQSELWIAGRRKNKQRVTKRVGKRTKMKKEVEKGGWSAVFDFYGSSLAY